MRTTANDRRAAFGQTYYYASENTGSGAVVRTQAVVLW